MTMSKYCKSKKMTLQEYENFSANIKTIAATIKSQLRYNNGLYFPTSEIISYNTNSNIKCFIIQELKNLGIEFFNNCEEYRVTD